MNFHKVTNRKNHRTVVELSEIIFFFPKIRISIFLTLIAASGSIAMKKESMKKMHVICPLKVK